MDMVNETSLTIPSWCNKSNIPVILNGRDKFFRFLLAVTEVFWAIIAHYDERIILFYARIIS